MAGALTMSSLVVINPACSVFPCARPWALHLHSCHPWRAVILLMSQLRKLESTKGGNVSHVITNKKAAEKLFGTGHGSNSSLCP